MTNFIKKIIKTLSDIFDWTIDWTITDKEIWEDLDYGRD